MTDDLTRLKALEAALRSTTQEMATTCSVPMELWDRHSNAVLEAAGALAALSSARAETVRTIKNRLDCHLNDHLVEMREGYDDSITGFNEAWDIVRSVLADMGGNDAERG